MMSFYVPIIPDYCPIMYPLFPNCFPFCVRIISFLFIYYVTIISLFFLHYVLIISSSVCRIIYYYFYTFPVGLFLLFRDYFHIWVAFLDYFIIVPTLTFPLCKLNMH